ncbi:MAG: acyl carrier protein [bacterium]
MDKNDFLMNFADQFEDTDPSEIMLTTKFKELNEWDSLMVLSIIAMIDAEYDIQLKGVDIRDTETIEGLFELVKSRR